MSRREHDERFMAMALVVSHQALPACEPNPPVGCVIARDTAVVAQGFTGPPGLPHAEAAALAALLPSMSRELLTAYVTLEPCSFFGRTPSCAEALVGSGIRRVVVGIVDPDPRNDGAGIDMLRAAGIDVEVGVLEAEIRAFIQPYLGRALA